MFVATLSYNEMLEVLVQKIQDEQLNAMGPNTITVQVYVEKGRKFDRIMIATHKKGQLTTAKPRYFVCKKRGNIYGALSPLAPNFKWYFGDLNTMYKWDWSGYHARPRVSPQDAGVVVVGRYGDYDHYEKVSRNNDPVLVSA